MVDKFLALLGSRLDLLLAASVFILLIFIHFYRKKKMLNIKRWKKSLNLEEHSHIFHELYQHVDGFSISKQARQKQDAIEYVYGEIEFFPFIALLSLAKPDNNTVFYDLGSGTGKAVLACAMVYPVKNSIGIELLPELHQEACNRTKQLASIKNYKEQAQKIKFILGSFLEVNLNDATLIFINATTLIGAIWTHLCARIDQLPHLNSVITTSKPLISSHFFLFKSTLIQMSWGIVKVYIHHRKRNLN